MEDCTVKNDKLDNDISDKFLCCVCLELLYKPIVLSCGHVSCFWCVHNSMNDLRESNCPICRDPYVHFPAVCRKLHVLLKKMYPLAHKMREEQVLKKERKQHCFSPQIDFLADESKVHDDALCSGNSVNVSDKQKVEECSNAVKSSPNSNKVSTQISKDDLLCSACKKLLASPGVLNCGHVYCQGCVVDMAEEREKIKCLECNVCHPRGFPKVCLVLEQFLEESFPEEYNTRRSKIQKTLAKTSNRSLQSVHKEGTSISVNNNNNDLPWQANPRSYVHIGVGCDSCGAYPIVGDRYVCKDCKDKMGYDLCKDCYERPLKVPGRFNQQHTRDHRLELVVVAQIRILTE
ncbi:unnamed protein product [Cochlearia groenlandica]